MLGDLPVLAELSKNPDNAEKRGFARFSCRCSAEDDKKLQSVGVIAENRGTSVSMSIQGYIALDILFVVVLTMVFNSITISKWHDPYVCYSGWFALLDSEQNNPA